MVQPAVDAKVLDVHAPSEKKVVRDCPAWYSKIGARQWLIVNPIQCRSRCKCFGANGSRDTVGYGTAQQISHSCVSLDQATSSICPTSAETLVHTTSESLNTSNSDQQSDFLIGLYEEAKALKSDAHRQRALNLIRDLVISERNDPDSITQNKIRNDQSAISNKSETNTNAVSVQTMDNSLVETSNYLTEPNEAEKPLTRISSESNVPWSSQNLPTAAITPLSKHATSQSASTGAIRKKSKHQSATFEDTLTSTHACSYESLQSDSVWENIEHTSMIPNGRLPCDFPGTVVENILVDLQSALPFGQLCLLEDSASFWAAVTSYIIYRIRVHINIPLSQKALTSLRQALDHALARFTGANFCDCEADFLKCIAEFLYESLSCFVSTGRFTSNTIYSSAPDDETSVLDVDDKIPELTVKMPMDADDKTHELCISMPTEENDVYSSQFRSVLLQNVINGAGAEGNLNPQVDVQPNGAVGSEDDARCECHPEAEAEPEVEAGTEADLAEADQSPGQQGAVGVSASIPLTASDNWSFDQAAVVLGRNVNISNTAVVSNNEDVSGISDDASEILLGAQFCSDICVPVVIFDDIPTKLSPCSEEEPQRTPKEETVNPGRSEDENEIGEFSAENNCENEQNSLK
ncbi:uncharacterized protein LOC118193468 [Stegodyphus dumicola]|uniref:uncharacterized protein LOC118193468 n=1 Tax=Stegodyphus dumicola TaxID=202533 RepID=UPI0015AC41DF|nr:uncharacterized protein LOC118193468 [Stegodyphus dumicola]